MILLPIHDLPTRSSSGFLIRYVLPRSLPPQLVGPLDRKLPFSTLAMGDAIIGVGHGSQTEFCGHNDEVILNTETVPNIKGKVIVLISCETARELGPALINMGAASYIGFREDLNWIVDAELAAVPWVDSMAVPAMMPIVDAVNALLDGKTSMEAFTILREELQANAKIEDDELIKSCLQFNHDNAVLLGDPETRVRARPPLFFPCRLIPPPPIVLPLWS